MAGRASAVKKWGDDGGGPLISPDGVAPKWMVSVSSSVIFPCTMKSRRRFILAPAYLGSPGKRAVKWLCVYVCVCAHFTDHFSGCVDQSVSCVRVSR